MAGFKVYFKKSVEKDFAAIPKKYLQRIIKLIVGQAANQLDDPLQVFLGYSGEILLYGLFEIYFKSGHRLSAS